MDAFCAKKILKMDIVEAEFRRLLHNITNIYSFTEYECNLVIQTVDSACTHVIDLEGTEGEKFVQRVLKSWYTEIKDWIKMSEGQLPLLNQEYKNDILHRNDYRDRHERLIKRINLAERARNKIRERYRNHFEEDIIIMDIDSITDKLEETTMEKKGIKRKNSRGEQQGYEGEGDTEYSWQTDHLFRRRFKKNGSSATACSRCGKKIFFL